MMPSSIRRSAAAVAAVLTAATALSLVNAAPALAAAPGTVQTAGDPLNVRRAPTTAATVVRTVANGAAVSIDCQTTGPSVTGPLGTSTLWDYIPALGGYISDTYVKTGSDGRIAPDCGVGSGSAECSTGACAAEGLFRSSDARFSVWDRDADGKSAVVAYWLKGGIGPLYVWNSSGNGTQVDKVVSVPDGGWVHYKTCVANYSATSPVLEACSNGITDFAS
ncbi:hypothetical protein [Amycolatopsis magusensis]|uniref:Uncharacterized protein YraI n=1 Tax=Amycolatopsis magusensis TaxID=882444 RepID=A0ABS4PP59_9PSEU|nr:hypothetical protein [Amycolatopsis magusensis]MBP2181187.1 uncharacterized protein YraI [Amycolatopsis magusensis]MDI5977395.1 hypothetical protein [Amycolatopsis magusensis]